jgi:hypothetical protein
MGEKDARFAADQIWRKAGVAVVTGALAVALVPTGAFAADASTQQATSGSASTQQGPGGSGEGGTPPDMPSGDQVSGGAPGGSMPGGGGGGANSMTYDYSGTLSGALAASGESKTSSGESVSATSADQNAALVQNGGTLDVTNGTLTKSGDDTNGDNCNFYGLNSILLGVGSSSKAYVSNTKLSATSEGSNGIFSTDGATVYANSDTIDTTAGNSRGLDATYGGTIVANDMTITTQGDHCAGVATDRGGGTINLTNSKLSTAGSGSPLLYSTGDIQVDNVTGTATGSQIAGMEGLNTILINNSTLESTQTDKTASDPIADGIIIYQSTSGDAESTTGAAATFDAANSTLKSAIASGSMFYFTNTTANVVLSKTTLDFDSSKASLIEASGNDSNSWGTAGKNGATVNFTGLSETMSGNVDADTISTVDLYLLEGTSWTGAASISTNANGATSASPLTVNVDASSTWVVTGNSTVSNLNVASGGKVVDSSGKTVTIVANGQTVVSGDSAYTVTVNGSYGTTVTTSDANKLSSDVTDRSDFDSHYSTSTTWTMGDGTASQTSASTSSATTTAATTQTTSTSSANWWDSVASWFMGLFGM